ncbi:MAG: hypothetical protein LC114_23630 [Bryobacterales bacterium]|nr:hypothetical protein [Bryobacterales bacterium]
MKLVTDEACAFLTNQLAEFLTEIDIPSASVASLVCGGVGLDQARAARAAVNISCIGTTIDGTGESGAS